MSGLVELLTERYEQRVNPSSGNDVFARLDYEPNCAARSQARKAGVPEGSLPSACGRCPQELFHAATEYNVLYGGAAGGGKTKALLMEGLRWCATYPGLRVGAFRRTYGELKESLLAELAAVAFAEAIGAKYNGTEYDLNFSNGSKLMFRYAESLQDATRRQGGQYQGVLFDERTLTPPDVCAFIESRIRSGRAAVPVMGIRSGSNPGGPGHSAVKKYFIDSTDYGQKVILNPDTDETVRFIPSKLTDNPHLNTAYGNRLNALPEAMRKAFRDGSWDVFAGQVFTEWNHDRHIVPAFAIPTTWPRYAGIDWGFSAPWAVEWGAVDEDGRVWIYREVTATQVGEKDQAQRILEMEAGEPLVARYADDAMWTGRGDAKSVAAVYMDNGCHIVHANKGERITGWQRVHSYLSDGPACLHHRDLGWETCPRLHVLQGAAPELVRTLPALPYDTTPSRMEDVDTKAEDHQGDALRYLLINLADPASFIFDDETRQVNALQLETMTTRPDEPGTGLDFTGDRPETAGTAIRSPYA